MAERKRKTPPSFWREETSGNVADLKLKQDYFKMTGYDTGNDKLLMSPYSEYIPLSYLFCNSGFAWYSDVDYADRAVRNGVVKYGEDLLKFREKWLNTLIGSMLPNTTIDNNPETVKQSALKDTINRIGKWLKQDVAISMQGCIDISFSRIRDRETIIHNIETSFKFHQRSYNGAYTPYSLYKEASDYRMGYIPHALAVVTPENFIYQKYMMLTQNKIDLSRVIVLIDRELDTPRFVSQPFRKLYQELLLPRIMDSGCQVWKVPHEYIMENCFHDGSGVLEGETARERRKSMDDLIDAFYKKMEHPELPTVATVESPTDYLEELIRGYVGGVDPYVIQTGREGIERLDEALNSLAIGSGGQGIWELMNNAPRQVYTPLADQPIAQLGGLTSGQILVDTDNWTWQHPIDQAAPVVVGDAMEEELGF